MLLVCTGNICRSAFAERLGRAYLAEALGGEAGAIRIVSAGTRAVVGSAMHPDSARALRGFGAEPGDFRARQLNDAMAAEADLTLTMTRGHRRDVLHGAPRAMARTFTLREAADLLRLVGVDAEPNGDDYVGQARGLVRELAAARARRQSGERDDIRDPIGQPPEVHEEVGELITAALLPVLRRLVSLRPSANGRAPDPAVDPVNESSPGQVGPEGLPDDPVSDRTGESHQA
ncbi:MAG: protein tyrosine phosphatase [Blastococcus sp.]|nr:protein tyrosine phosphatase [Blastococcus sp.]